MGPTGTPTEIPTGENVLLAGGGLGNAVLFVDAGARGIPSEVFAQTWRGVAYSAIPAKFQSNPTGAFFDSDATSSASGTGTGTGSEDQSVEDHPGQAA